MFSTCTASVAAADPELIWHRQRPGASGWITVQGKGRMGKLALQTPAMIRFGEETEDEVFISHEAAAAELPPADAQQS